MKKQITKQRVTRVIATLLQSPNKSAKRAALWKRLHDLRNSL